MANTLELLNAVGVNQALSPPIFSAFQTVGQSITSGFTGLAISLGTPEIDTYGGWSAGSPSRYTAQVPGWYLFIGGFGYPTNSTNVRVAQLQKNGSPTRSISTGTNALSDNNFNLAMQAVGFFQMNGTTDYVEMWGYQDSGSTLTTIPNLSYLMALKIHT